jgi:hypothetical protein
VARREPEPEHRRREERRHRELGAQRPGAEERAALALPQAGHGAGEALAPRAVEQPQPSEGEREHRRPAQQPIVAVEHERREPVGAVEVAERKARVGGALALGVGVGRVGRRPAVEPLVDRHVQGDAEGGELDRPEGQRAPAGAHERADREGPDDDAGRHELRPEPGKRAEQSEAAERRAPRDRFLQSHGEERGPRQGRAGRKLGIDGGPVGHERRREAHSKRRGERPGVGHDAQREPVPEGHRQRREGGEKQLHRRRAADRVRGCDHEWKADAVRLVQAAVRLAAVRLQRVRVEALVGARGVLVLQVGVAVLDDGPRRQQVMRLVPAVVGVAERVEAEGGPVGGEQDDPESERGAQAAEPRGLESRHRLAPQRAKAASRRRRRDRRGAANRGGRARRPRGGSAPAGPAPPGRRLTRPPARRRLR